MKILHLISSPMGEASNSTYLSNAIVEKLKIANPDSIVTVHDLTKNPFPHLEEAHIRSFFTPIESRSEDQLEAIKRSDVAIAELKDADTVVIGVPMYNFNLTSSLKSWIDHIARSGETFRYSAESGPEGLVKNKKVYLAIATGGIYTDGPMKDFDFIEPYLRTMLGFLGMTDITTFRVEGVNIPELAGTALDKAVESVNV